MSEYNVIFIIEFMPVLHAMLPAMNEVKYSGVGCDVLVPPASKSHDYIYVSRKSLITLIENLGFTVLHDYPTGKKYDIVYSAYHLHANVLMQMNKVRYNVKFSYYGVGGGNKPNLLNPFYFNFYDFYLSLSNPDASIASGYINTYIIGNIKLAHYKRLRTTPISKTTILYLPTWSNDGEGLSSISDRTIKKLLSLQNKYNISTKMHAYTSSSMKSKEQRKLFEMFDIVYDVNTPICDILNEADVVLSDISSAGFDAVAGDVPLAFFGLGESIYYGGKLCLHQQLVEDDIVPGSNNVEEMELIIEKALSPEYFSKQQKLKKEIYPYEGLKCLEAFIDFQRLLLDNQVDPWYIASRKVIRSSPDDINHLKSTINYYERKMSRRKKVLYGRGYFGERAFNFYGDDHVYAFVDKNKHGTRYLDKPVFHPSTLTSLCKEYEIIVCVKDYDDVEAYLNSINVTEFRIYYEVDKE